MRRWKCVFFCVVVFAAFDCTNRRSGFAVGFATPQKKLANCRICPRRLDAHPTMQSDRIRSHFRPFGIRPPMCSATRCGRVFLSSGFLLTGASEIRGLCKSAVVRRRRRRFTGRIWVPPSHAMGCRQFTRVRSAPHSAPNLTPTAPSAVVRRPSINPVIIHKTRSGPPPCPKNVHACVMDRRVENGLCHVRCVTWAAIIGCSRKWRVSIGGNRASEQVVTFVS